MTRALRQWMAFVAAACAGAAVVALPFPTGADRQGARTTEEARLETARERLRGASLVLDGAVRDLRAREAITRSASGANAAITIDRSVPPALRTMVDSLARVAWEGLGPRASARFAGVVVHFDTGGIVLARRVPEPNRSADLTYVLPSPATDGRCVAVVRIRRPEAHALPAARDLLGPCGFFAVFGTPGAAVSAWLGRTDYAFARRSDWHEDLAHPPAQPFGRAKLPAPAARCLSGVDAHCLHALALDAASDPIRVLGVARREPAVVGGVIGPVPRAASAGSWLGEDEPRFLAATVRELGEAQFAAFWAASEPDPAAAFENASGRRLDDWTRLWLERAVGSKAQGVAPETGNLVWLLLLIPLLTAASLRPREHVLWGRRPSR